LNTTAPGGELVWINGELVPAGAATVSVFDHGLTVGDGVFETLLVDDGQPYALTRHLTRLARSSAALALPAPDLDAIRAGVGELIAATAQTGRHRLRITFTGGPSPLGSDRGSASPTVILATAPVAARGPSSAVVTVPWPRNERGALAGLKTTSYAENVVALAYAHEREADEGIFANTRGELCEGTGSNVVVGIGGRLVTPPLDAGCLAGVTRALVLEGCDVVEEPISMADLARADEVFLTSATRAVHPVRDVDGRSLPAPGPLTQQAMVALAARAAESYVP
jgi:branched-chain amino acid aminotransferase